MRLTVLKKGLTVVTFLFYALISFPLMVLPIIRIPTETDITQLYAEIFLLIVCSLGILVFVFSFFRHGYTAVFEIGEKGVYCHFRKNHYFMPWENVKQIIMYPDMMGRITKNCIIFFIADDVPPPLPKKGALEYSDSFIGVQYRKGLLEIIRAYTSILIKNAEWIEI